MGRAHAAAMGIVLACLLAACQPRAEPYRFRGPLVGSVAAAELEPGSRQSAKPDAGPAMPRKRPLLAAAQASADHAPESGSPGLADELRALVGVRDGRSTHLAFALDVLTHLGVSVDAGLRELDRGRELVELARARDALDDGPPLLGDLVVFDAVQGEEPASLIGVVIGTDGAGTVELIHLSRGIVRRSFANTRHPTRPRDDDGRALNTFLRPGRAGDARGTRYLAGKLLTAFIRLDRLAATPP